VVVANVHLGLAGFERRLQLRKLLDSEIIRHTHRRTPLIVGGDYNDVWGTLGKNVMHPAGFAAAGEHILTYPAALPARALDRIFYRGELISGHAFASRLKIARHASDHLPLVADFQLLTESP
jgi:endonuclease/exonuclease/phosphatase family metal-dependent hydrolase